MLIAQDFWGKSLGADRLPVRTHLDDAEAAADALARCHRLTPSLAKAWNQPHEAVIDFLAMFAGLHDAGKYSQPFQAMLNGAGHSGGLRHTEALYLLLKHDAERTSRVFGLPAGTDTYEIVDLLRVLAPTIGHHGHAVRGGGGPGQPKLSISQAYPEANREAAWHAIEAIVQRREAALPAIHMLMHDERAWAPWSWVIAGFTVTADWIASNPDWFPVEEDRTTEAHVAAASLQEAGLEPVGIQQASLHDQMGFERLRPMQETAQEFPLDDDVYLIEDETGSGKTEAALILAQRLMQKRDLHGFFFALPTQATSNALHGRMKRLAPLLFTKTPQLVLAHSERNIVPAWMQPAQATDNRGDVRAECSAWLRDHSKASLIAQCGVGTVDQVVAGVLPLKHQCLRLFGLHAKVLIIDEVHAYDSYQNALLQSIIEHHRSTGGCVILLSATLPANIRRLLVSGIEDAEYPRIASASQARHVPSQLSKPKSMTPITTLQEAADILQLAHQEGRSGAWIRNTVDDAVESFRILKARGVPAVLMHSRFAQADRAEKEELILEHVGPDSGPQRAGFIVVSTQIIEQSLDVDFDVLVSELAPMDVLIQRMGRLHRHGRDAQGNRDITDGRPPATMHVRLPDVQEPGKDAFAHEWKGTAAVYRHAGVLWKTMEFIQGAPTFATLASLSQIVDEVYAPPFPDAFAQAVEEWEADAMSQRQHGKWTSLDLLRDDYASFLDPMPLKDAPTRLGMDRVTIVLTQNGVPARDSLAASRIHLPARQVADLPLDTESSTNVLQDQIDRGFVVGLLEEHPDHYSKETGLCKRI